MPTRQRRQRISQSAYPDYNSKFLLKEGLKKPTPQNPIPNFTKFVSNSSAVAPSKKVSMKIEGLYSLAYSAATYYNLIANSDNTDSNKSVFISVDESLNSTGICVSIPIMHALDSDKILFNPKTMRSLYAIMSSASDVLSYNFANNRNYSKFGHQYISGLESLFRSMLIESENLGEKDLDGKPIKNSVIRNLINTNTNYQNILIRLMAFCNTHFDASNRRICLVFNLVPPKDDNAHLYKLLYTSTSIKIISTGFVAIFNTMLRIGLNIGNNTIAGIEINNQSNLFNQPVYEIKEKDLGKSLDFFDRFSEIELEDLEEAFKVTQSFIFSAPSCNHIYSVEEVAASTNFMGISRTSMSFGSIASTLADIFVNDQFKKNSGRRKQNFFFVTNKQNLESFLRKKFKLHQNEAEAVEAAVTEIFKVAANHPKRMSLVMCSMYSGMMPRNDDVSDAYCHTLFSISMYQYLIALINLLLKNDAFVVREYEDKFKTRIVVDNLGFYDHPKNDIVGTCKNIESSFDQLNKMYGKRLSIDFRMVAKYLSKNISSQFARYLNDLNEFSHQRVMDGLEGNLDSCYKELLFEDLSQLRFSNNITYEKLSNTYDDDIFEDESYNESDEDTDNIEDAFEEDDESNSNVEE